MFHYLIKRLLLFVPTLLCVSTLVFSLIHLVPGDPVDLILGEQAQTVDREALRHALHLDRPLLQQYVDFLKGTVSGHMGNSLFEHRPVTQLIRERYPATLELALCSMIIALLISSLLGITAAVKKGSWWDKTSVFIALFGISVPHIWLGPLLVLLFSVTLHLLPVAGRSEPWSFLLPSLTLGSSMAAILTRMTRSSFLDNLKEDFVKTARAKGVSERAILLKHVLRNALTPVVAIIGLQFGALLTGAVVTEKIFAWPGLGSLLLQSIERRDYPVLQGCILVVAFTYTGVNLLTDLIQFQLDPRVLSKT